MTNGGYMKINGNFTTAQTTATTPPTFTPGTGTVELAANCTLPARVITSFNALLISGGTTTLGVSLNSTASTGSLTVNAGTTLSLLTYSFGAATAIPRVTLQNGVSGSTISGTTGTLYLGGDVTVTKITGTGVGATISCPVALTATRTFTVADETTPVTDLTVSGIISGTNFGVTKKGAGTMQVSGVNTFTGTTDVSEGTLIATTSTSALGAGNLTLSGGTLKLTYSSGLNFARNTTVSANSTIISDVSSSGAGVTHTLGTLSISAYILSINGGSNVTSGTAGLTFGAVTNTGTPTYTVTNPTGGGITQLSLAAVSNSTYLTTFNGNGNVVQTGVFGNGSGGVTYSGSGTLTLTQANTFTGILTVSSGTVVGASYVGALGAGTLTLSGGTLKLTNATGLNFARNTTVSANSAITSDVSSAGPGITHTLGTLSIGAYTLSINGGSNVTSGTAGLTFGAVTHTGAPTYTVTNPTGGGTTQLSVGAVGNSTYLTTFNGNGNVIQTGVIGSGSGGITYSGTGTLTLSQTNTYGGATTISSGTIKLGSGTAIPDVSALTVNGTFDLNGNSETVGSLAGSGTGIVTSSAAGNLTLTAGGDNSTTSYSGIIQNGTATSIALTKNGTGILTLSGNSTYSGLTTISAGTIKLGGAGSGSNTPLGTTTNGTTVSSGAVLDLNGNSLVTTEGLTLSGTGLTSSPAGALTNTGGNASYSGAITLGSSGATITATTFGTLTVSGNISGNTYPLTLDGASSSDGIISGVIGTTSGTVTKNGAGTWTLSNSNTYTGLTTVSDGFLTATNATALGTNAGKTNVNSGATLYINGGLTVAEPLTLDGGTLRTTLTVGSLATYTGAIDLTNASTIRCGSGNPLTISSTISNGGFDLTLTTPVGTTLTASNVISGGGGLIKGQGGLVVLSGANTYSGATSVTSGTLQAGVASVVNTSGAFGNNSAVTLTDLSGVVLDLNGFDTQIGSLTGGGTNGGNVSLGAKTLTIGGNNTSPSAYAGIISGTGGSITKIGSGTLILSGSNTYTGATTISAGTLKVGATGDATNTPLGTIASGTTVSATGAALDLNGFTLGTSEPLTLNGTGISGTGALINSSGAGTGATYNGAITLGSAGSIGTTSVTTGNITLGGGITGGFDLTKVGAGTLSLGSSTATLGALTISAGTLVSTSGTMNVAGDFTNDGAFTHNSGTVNLNKSGSTQSITGSSATTFNNLTISNSFGVTLGGSSLDETVTGTLNFSSGKITTGSNKLIVGSSNNAGTVSGADAGKYIYGNLRRYVPNSSGPTVGYDIGDATNYTPVSLTFSGTVSGSGYLDVFTSVPGSAPPAASYLSQSKYVNRKWTITNSGVGGFSSYAPTFTFVSGDLVGTPNTNIFAIRKYNGTFWAAATASTRTSTSTRCTGLTSFSDFYIGEDLTSTSNSVWFGTKDNDWNTTDNWCSGDTPTVPTTSTDVTVPYTGVTNFPTVSGSYNCQNITIESGASLVVTSAGNLTVSGTATVKRSITLDNHWHMLSSPVISQDIWPEFAPEPTDGGTLTFGPGPYNWDFYYFNPYCNVHGLSWVNLRKTGGYYNEGYVDDPSSNAGFGAATPAFTPGRGYLIAYNTGWTSTGSLASKDLSIHTFSGTLNNGSVSTSIIDYSSSGGYYSNLVGNPYPSSIDWDASPGWTKTNLLINSYWIWNDQDGNYGVYDGAAGTLGTSQCIAPAQGFFVKAKNTTTGYLTMDNDVRTHSTQAWLKQEKADPVNHMRLRVTTDQNTYSDEMIFGVNSSYGNDGSDKFASMYAEAPELWSIKNGNSYSIDHLPSIDQNTTITIGIKAGVNGNYTVTATGVSEFGASSVLLEDLKTATTQELKNNPVYTFSGGPGDATERLRLHFGGPFGVGTTPKVDPVTIYSYGNSIYIRSNSATDLQGNLFVFNLIGQKMMQQRVDGKFSRIDLNVPAGCYVVTLVSDKQTVSKKVLVH
ncbi:MAG: autotransporter-associated beta strand repeat-containing protein [Bacteroidetes bacterium]|nr:autotransporter-associated beta strand repeat-containing protein [Bacteroidota bacterium]